MKHKFSLTALLVLLTAFRPFLVSGSTGSVSVLVQADSVDTAVSRGSVWWGG
ncbi:MAG: hypothetical protein R3D55_11430 [Chloroflexota bacterium]